MREMPITRRQADEFAAAVERALGSGGPLTPAARGFDNGSGGRSQARDVEMRAFVSLVEQLRQVQSPPLRTQFATDLRARLMAAAPVELSAAERSRASSTESASASIHTTSARSSLRRRLVSAGVTVSVVLGAGTGVAVASQSALPGETLYPVKRSLEQIEVSLAGSAGDKGEELLEQASTRLDEVGGLAAGDLSAPEAAELVSETLDLFTTQSAEGAEELMSAYTSDGNQESIALLREFAEQSVSELDELGSSLSRSWHDQLTLAAEGMADLDAQAMAMCSDCSSLGPLQLSGNLVAGQGQLPGDGSGGDGSGGGNQGPGSPGGGPGPGENPPPGDPGSAGPGPDEPGQPPTPGTTLETPDEPGQVTGPSESTPASGDPSADPSVLDPSDPVPSDPTDTPTVQPPTDPPTPTGPTVTGGTQPTPTLESPKPPTQTPSDTVPTSSLPSPTLPSDPTGTEPSVPTVTLPTVPSSPAEIEEPPTGSLSLP